MRHMTDPNFEQKKIEIAMQEQNVQKEEDLQIWKTFSNKRKYTDYNGSTAGTLNYISIFGEVIGIKFINLEKGVKPEDYFPKIKKGDDIEHIKSYHVGDSEFLVFYMKTKKGDIQLQMVIGYDDLYTLAFEISSNEVHIPKFKNYKSLPYRKEYHPAYLRSYMYDHTKAGYETYAFQPLGKDLDLWFDYMSKSKIFDKAEAITLGYEFRGVDSNGDTLRVQLICDDYNYDYGVIGVQAYKNNIAQQCIEVDPYHYHSEYEYLGTIETRDVEFHIIN